MKLLQGILNQITQDEHFNAQNSWYFITENSQNELDIISCAQKLWEKF